LHITFKPIWILMKERRWSGSGISWTICKSLAPRSRQITKPALHHSTFYKPNALPDTQPMVLIKALKPITNYYKLTVTYYFQK